MKNMRELFVRPLFIIGCSLFICAAHAAPRDASVDCSGRPRWDRFIVNESDTRWSVGDNGCVVSGARSGVKIRTAPPPMAQPQTVPVEQIRTAAAPQKNLYGNYDAGWDPSAMYGKYRGGPNDWSRMYGKYDPSANPGIRPQPKVAPIKKSEPVARIAVKPKPNPKPKPKAIPIAPRAAVVAEPVDIKPLPVPVPVKPIPDEKAENIARVLGDTIIGEDSFCTRIAPGPVLGRLPGGLVLMPGRPDQMNCIRK